jgi:hypothetical protein
MAFSVFHMEKKVTKENESELGLKGSNAVEFGWI